jgi:hypothetical protein
MMLELLAAIQPRFMCSHLRSWIEDSVKEGWVLFSSSIGRPPKKICRIVPSSEIKRIGGLN